MNTVTIINKFLSEDFVTSLIEFADEDSRNTPYDIAVASETLAKHAKKLGQAEEAMEDTARAAKAWRQEATGESHGPSEDFLSFLNRTLESLSAPAADKAAAGEILGEYWDCAGDPEQAAKAWREAAKNYATLVDA